MNTALFVWCLIAGMTVVACVAGLIMKVAGRHGALRHAAAHAGARHHRLISIGTEREEFFIPGDPLKDDDYDDEL